MSDYRSLSELHLWERNYNKGNVAFIKSSIQRFGFNNAVRVWQDGVIVAGNHSTLALRELQSEGWIPHGGAITPDWEVRIVDVSHLSESEAYAFAIADNRSASLADTDEGQLALLLADLQAADPALVDVLQFGAAELEALMRQIQPTPEIMEDDGTALDRAEELQRKWGTTYGQLWEIPSAKGGHHRLLCGDSRSQDDVIRIVGDTSLVMMWTDPPYGVAYEGKTTDHLTITNDGADSLPQLLAAAFAAADAVLPNGAPIYVAHPAGALSLAFIQAFIGMGWKLHQSLVWVKDSMVVGHSDYHYQHEPILYGWKGTSRPWYGGRNQKSTLIVDRPKASAEHPTMKPIALVAMCITNSSRMGEVIYEPFSGSGTTLLACEQSGRLCHAIEIEPKYIAVALERLSALGLSPQLIG